MFGCIRRRVHLGVCTFKILIFKQVDHIIRSTVIESSFRGNNSITFPSLEMYPSEIVLLKGDSGSGKSSFIHSLAGLIPIKKGSVTIKGHGELNEKTTPRNWRKDAISFIPQKPLFWASLSALDNIKLSQWAKGISAENIESLLKKLGIQNLINQAVNKLSIGEQQRLSAIRAFISNAPVVFADEPTAALDKKNTWKLIDFMKEHQNNTGCSILLSSHDSRLDSIADSIITLK